MPHRLRHSLAELPAAAREAEPGQLLEVALLVTFVVLLLLMASAAYGVLVRP